MSQSKVEKRPCVCGCDFTEHGPIAPAPCRNCQPVSHMDMTPWCHAFRPVSEAGVASLERAYKEIEEEHARHKRRVDEIMEQHALRLDELGLKKDAAEVRRQIRMRAA